jgi:hypothetical protein
LDASAGPAGHGRADEMSIPQDEYTIEIRFQRATREEAAKALRWLADQVEHHRGVGGDYNYPLAWKWKAKRHESAPAEEPAR